MHVSPFSPFFIKVSSNPVSPRKNYPLNLLPYIYTGLPALPPPKAAVARRGMHSATGAYWDNQKDGMWSFKYDKGEDKGFDVVLSVVWIAMPGLS